MLSAVNIGMHVSFQMMFSGYMLRSGITWLEMEILDLTYEYISDITWYSSFCL